LYTYYTLCFSTLFIVCTFKLNIVCDLFLSSWVTYTFVIIHFFVENIVHMFNMLYHIYILHDIYCIYVYIYIYVLHIYILYTCKYAVYIFTSYYTLIIKTSIIIWYFLYIYIMSCLGKTPTPELLLARSRDI
jgi:hypothetical protein